MIHLSGKLLKLVFCETISVQPMKLLPSEICYTDFDAIVALRLNPARHFELAPVEAPTRI